MFNSGVESAEKGRPKNAMGTLQDFDSQCSNTSKLIQPLYKYMKNNECLLCGFVSKAKDPFKIRRHLHVHVTDKLFQCDTCDKKFSTPQYLMNHRNTHKDVFPFPCDLCDKKYRDRASIKRHKKKKHVEKQEFKCEVCNKVLSSNWVLKEHLRIHTGERPFECGLCKQSFRLKCLLSKHLLRHDSAYKTQLLQQGTVASNDSSSAMVSLTSESNVDLGQKCRQSISLTSADPACFIPVTESVAMSCAFGNNRNACRENSAQIRRRPQSGAVPAEGGRPENATSADTLGEFRNRCIDNTKPIQPLYKYMKNNKCLLCGFESKAKELQHIRKHLFVHVSNKEFKCDTCEKKFLTLIRLVKHRRIHKDVFPFSCDQCDKKYRDKDGIRDHKRRKHGEKHTFKCQFCDKVLSTNFVLKEHLRIHTGERPFLCGFCKKYFRTKCLLSKHRPYCASAKIHESRQCSPNSDSSCSSATNA